MNGYIDESHDLFLISSIFQLLKLRKLRWSEKLFIEDGVEENYFRVLIS